MLSTDEMQEWIEQEVIAIMKSFLVVVTMVLVAPILIACSVPVERGQGGQPTGKVRFDGSYPAYESIPELAKPASLIVRGTVGEVVAREMDGGGEDESDGHGIPMVFMRLDVSESMTAASTPSEIVLGWLDLGRIEASDVSELLPGQEVVLFLERLDRKSAPGIESLEGEFYVPLSADNGVFDVDSRGTIRARSEIVWPSGRGERLSEGLLALSLDDLRSTVRKTG